MNFICFIFFLVFGLIFSDYNISKDIIFNKTDFRKENNLNSNFFNINIIGGDTIPIFEVNGPNNETHNILLDLNSNENWIIPKFLKSNLSKNPFNQECENKNNVIKFSDIHFENINLNKDCNITITLFNQKMTFYSLINYTKVYSFKYFDGILSFNNLIKIFDKDNCLIVNFTNQTIINSNSFNNSNFVNILNKNETNKFQINYIIFGSIIDLYLAKKLNISGSFDSLSYFSFVPYSYINYFLENFFEEIDECKEERFGTSSLHYIYCNKASINLDTLKKKIFFVINEYAFSLPKLFNDTSFLFKKEGDNLIYFTILFKENSSEIVLGSNFLNDKIMFINSTIYLYSNDMESFKKTENLKLLLYVLTLITFFVFLTILFICDKLKKRKLKNNFEEEKQKIKHL